ncbi:membrane protein [Rhodopirellula europaea 6C]|uniref:Membrane protein n=1 Tax=Rhodopirellula europaea 6C TaxID=1263867 RepID=M2B2U4_9BACT|nr:membrane protein [Rhodopirellula europaea 6C]
MSDVLLFELDHIPALNPYSTPSQATSDSGSAAGPSILYTIQTVWIATGISLLTLAIIASLIFDGSLRRLFFSDDSYVASFSASVSVAAFFAVGCLAGWWFQSSRIALLTTVVLVASFGTILWVSDYLHDFGEGDQIIAYLGIGVLSGGSFGLTAFSIHNTGARAVFSIAPHLCFGIGYAAAVHTMSP